MDHTRINLNFQVYITFLMIFAQFFLVWENDRKIMLCQTSKWGNPASFFLGGGDQKKNPSVFGFLHRLEY